MNTPSRTPQDIYEACFQDSPAATILCVFNTGLCIDTNEAFTRLTGYPRTEIVGRSSKDLALWHDPAQREAIIAKLVEHSPVYGQEILIRQKSGTTIQAMASLGLMQVADTTYMLAHFFDITARKRAEVGRIELELQRAQRLESLGTLAGGIAHDFNNLLTGIFGNIDLASADSPNPAVTEHLQAIRNTLDRARSLTAQLLTFAKGGAPVQKVEALSPFLEDTINFALSGSNIARTITVAPDLRLCNFDRNQMSQVIDNLTINALQAMPAGGSLRVATDNISFQEHEHHYLQKGDYVRISIIDSGAGIPPEILPRIFDPFFTTKQKGSGLGLAICYSIVNRHAGCIDVESEPGKGSAFHVYLPAATQAPAAFKRSRETVHRGTGKILVMDDEEVVRNTMAAILNRSGYTCTVTENGEAALQAFTDAKKNNEPFSALIFDMTITGGMGGLEAAMEIRKTDTEIPILVASGYTEDAVIANPKAFGFNGCIRKPFTSSELEEMLNQALRK